MRVGLTRFICGIMMHIACTGEFCNGMKMMKFAVNHDWKFVNYHLAFLPGFLQTLSMIFITQINYQVIMINSNALEIAKDFTALMIIADFDNLFGAISGNETAKKMLTEKHYEFLFKIERTSSNEAKFEKNAEIFWDDWVINKINKRRMN